MFTLNTKIQTTGNNGFKADGTPNVSTGVITTEPFNRFGIITVCMTWDNVTHTLHAISDLETSIQRGILKIVE